MRKLVLVFLVFSVFCMMSAPAQDSKKPAAQHAVSTKAMSLTGTISLDGQSLVNDDDTIWGISNPDVLKGHEGQRVTVKCRVDREKNAIHVLLIKLEPVETRQAVNLGDPAFRR